MQGKSKRRLTKLASLEDPRETAKVEGPFGLMALDSWSPAPRLWFSNGMVHKHSTSTAVHGNCNYQIWEEAGSTFKKVLDFEEEAKKEDAERSPGYRRLWNSGGMGNKVVCNPSTRQVTWYAGKTPNEDGDNYVVVTTSGNGGKTWAERFLIDPDAGGPVRAFDPEIWMDPEGKLWCFWAQTIGKDGRIAGVWAMTNDDPDKGSSDWSQPRRLTDGIMMCKPTVLSSGEWVLPASTWRGTDNSARVVVSTNNGQTWSLRGACDVPKKDRSFDEHTGAREILMAAFTEDNVITGNPSSASVSLRMIVSKHIEDNPGTRRP